MKGADLKALMELRDWKSLNNVQRYTNPNPEHTKRAVDLPKESSPAFFNTPVFAKSVTPCAPIAQMDRASAF